MPVIYSCHFFKTSLLLAGCNKHDGERKSLKNFWHWWNCDGGRASSKWRNERTPTSTPSCFLQMQPQLNPQLCIKEAVKKHLGCDCSVPGGLHGNLWFFFISLHKGKEKSLIFASSSVLAGKREKIW